jgi:chitodextrinase
VTRYRVYRAGTLLATLGAVTTYQNTGLTASTGYSYTVQAVDAAGNASAQSTSASATTQAASDTIAPSVPTGLVGTAVSSTQINLSWNPSTDNVGVTGYYVYLNDVALTTTTATSFQHTGLTAGTTYNYRVGAYDAVPNHSAWTVTPVSVTTPPALDTIPPSVPTGLTATAVSSAQINLSWAASTDNVGVTGYRVYRAGTLLATLGAVSTYQNTGLAASTSYSYTVQAVDAAGNASAQSNAASATTQGAPDTVAPTTPTGLLASAVSSSQINLSWSASTDNVGVTGYRVYRAGTLLVTLGAVTSYQNTGLSASTGYSYTVQAVDAAGNASAQSNAASATTQGAPDTVAPTTPTGVSASAVSSSLINLSWAASTDNVGVTGYRVYRAGTLLATLGAVSTYQNTGLAASTSYSYTVQAVDAAGNASAQSNAASATTQGAPDTVAPTTPTGLLASAVSSSQINLSWSASTDNVGVTGYRVYRAGTLLVTLGAVTSYQNTGLSASTGYSYTVQAVDAAGNASAQSNSASATTQAAADTQAPTVPTGLKGRAASSPTQINLTWNASTDNVGVVGYYVYLNDVPLATTTGTSFQHTGLTPGTTYNYRVSAYDAVPNHSAWNAKPVSVRTTRRRIIGHDFNGDGMSDILWRSNTSGQNAIWLMNGTTLSSNAAIPTVTDLNWSIAGVGDFDGYGNSDILWRNRATGENVIWLMNGTTLRRGGQLPTEGDLDWSIVGVGDFDGNGKSDILWRHRTTGENAIWLLNGTNRAGGGLLPTEPDLNWSIVGVGDFDGDGKSDILWRNRATGETAIWLVNGTTLSAGGLLPAVTDLNWSIVGAGDFDADGKSDILWRNNATGENMIWLVNGTTLSSSVQIATQADLNWSIAGVGDFDGDGKPDILWRNSTTGQHAIWLMNGATFSSSAAINTVPGSDWSIAPR